MSQFSHPRLIPNAPALQNEMVCPSPVEESVLVVNSRKELWKLKVMLGSMCLFHCLLLPCSGDGVTLDVLRLGQLFEVHCY
jgi:hypothetical protein